MLDIPQIGGITSVTKIIWDGPIRTFARIFARIHWAKRRKWATNELLPVDLDKQYATAKVFQRSLFCTMRVRPSVARFYHQLTVWLLHYSQAGVEKLELGAIFKTEVVINDRDN